MSVLGMLTLMTGDVSAGAGLIAQSAELIDTHDLDRLATSAHTLTGLALAQTLLRDSQNAAATLARARRLTAQLTGIVPWFAVSGPLDPGSHGGPPRRRPLGAAADR